MIIQKIEKFYEMVIMSDDDLSRPYYPLVSLKKAQDDLRRMMAETVDVCVITIVT